MSGASIGPSDITGATDDELSYSLPETRQLWSLLDGSIMDVAIRHHLWDSWGLCPRHSWAYAVAEIELRGRRPFSTTILYEDLTGRARRLLGRSLPWALLRRQLRASASCLTCDFLKVTTGVSLPVDEDLWKRLNRLSRTPRLVAETASEWRPRSCPECLGGRGPTCRAHLLRSPRARRDCEALAEQLADLRRRLDLYLRSMTWRGPAVGPAEQSSWVEALGWFAGWATAERLAARVHRRP